MVADTNLKRRLDELNMTQKELAQALGEKYTTVNAWVTGYRKPQLPDALRIAAVVNVDTGDLGSLFEFENGGGQCEQGSPEGTADHGASH